ncbi:MAG: DUF3500 domain-containing protein [Verrucomicrobiales bacterium]|nr:DUF3500 domain-containing protein [Verrucomicrobiales bacterium]
MRKPRRFTVMAVWLWASLLGVVPVLRAAESAAVRVTQAADAFVRTLNESQRRGVQFEFNDAAQRTRWSNLPVSMAKRAGLRLGDLTAEQRAAAMNLLRAALSERGYEKILGIVQSDEVLRRQGNSTVPFGQDEFFISFMGKPSVSAPWMLQFGGHHLALNLTMAGDQGVLTPSLIAVQPAMFEWNGKTVRPMGRETDKALALVQSLDATQRKAAVLAFEMRDLALGPGHDGETIAPEGVQVATFSAAQRQLLLELVAEWSGIIHDAAAQRKLKEIESKLDQTWFAWSGPLEAGKAYFRVQGPTLIIEYAPQRLGGDVTMHIHSMVRDPTNDYGKQFLP